MNTPFWESNSTTELRGTSRSPAVSEKTKREAKAKQDREAKAKHEREAKAKQDREAKAKREREAKAKTKQDREAKAKREREAKAKQEREAKAKREREAKAKTKQDREAKAKREREAKAKQEREAKAKREREAKAKRDDKDRKPRHSGTPRSSATPTPPTPTRSATPSTSAPATSTAPTAEPTRSTSPTSTRSPGDDDGQPRDYDSQADFSSHQMQQGTPETEHWQEPNYSVSLDVSNRDLRFPDGEEFRMWVFDSEESGRGFPGPTLRPKEGEIFHAYVEPSMGPHTIHWHGMEPDPRNDGVGHTSFEIDDHYTYQWQAEPGRAGNPNYGAAGTYFYHCHVNTPLHAQMGLLGPLVVDPVVLADFPVNAGNRRAFADGPEYDIETESLIMPFSIDRRWHDLGHAAGLSGEDVGLNRFEPTHFYITGGLLNSRREREGAVWAPTELPVNVIGNGKAPTLMRVLDGNYLPNKLTFYHPDGSPARIAELISHDGRPFRHSSSQYGVAIPTSMHEDPKAHLFTHMLSMGAAERYDILLHPPVSGIYILRMEWNNWITGVPVGRKELRLVAS
ncbi:cell envelope integrity protein TolA [Glutamicibacter bergerei]